MLACTAHIHVVANEWRRCVTMFSRTNGEQSVAMAKCDCATASPVDQFLPAMYDSALEHNVNTQKAPQVCSKKICDGET